MSARRASRPSARTAAVPRGRVRGSTPEQAPAPTAPDNVVPHPTLALLRTRSLAGEAQREIERMILGGQLAPGEKLTEARLTALLGVSRGPVREAFRKLEEAGLLRQEKNRGVFVRAVPPDEVAEIYEVRAAMDALVGRRAAERAGAEDLRALRGLVERMEAAARASDPAGYYALNLEFHDRLVSLAGNRKLAETYRRLIKELALARRRNLSDREVLVHSSAEHRAILKAIAAGDGASAARLMHEHALESRDRALQAEPERPPARARAPRRAAE